ncbi:hypothetical protein SprV_0100216900 [Sparganum proliferum]
MLEWRNARNSPGYNPQVILTKFSELFEEQINIFYRTDPDPLDDRHPLRTDSNCELGQLLRLITLHDSFFERLTDYLCGSDDPNDPTVRAAARLLCSIHFGVTLSFTVGEGDITVNTLYKLALSDAEPTNCYALLLLGSILDNAELLYVTKHRNIELVPIVLNRMASYIVQLESDIHQNPTSSNDAGFSNRLGSFCLEPMTLEMKLRLCMSYLTSLAEYQDMMPYMYDGGVLRYVYKFLEADYSGRDIRLTFEALRLLANLLCHRCIHLDFVESRGLELVLKVPRPSVAATAVSVVLYYTAYFEDAMERVCQLPSPILHSLIMYSLWLIECAHPSARCYSLYFLSIALCYGATFDLFREHQGLRYLYNALCVLPIRLTEDEPSVQKDSTSWHVVRASLLTIRRFFDISLLLWMDTVDPSLAGIFDEPPRIVAAAGNRLINYSTEQMNRLLALLVFRMRPDTIFAPIQELADLGAIPLLYRIIARNVYAHANWPGRCECTRIAVDILNIMSLSYNLAEAIVAADVYCYPDGQFSIPNSEMASRHSHLHHRRRRRDDGEDADDDEEEEVDDEDGTINFPRVIVRGNHNAGPVQLIDLLFGPVRHRGTTNQQRQPRNPRATASTSSAPSSATTRQDAGTQDTTGPGSSRRNSRRSGGPPRFENLEIDGHNEDSTSDERVNGLLMLFTLPRDDESWDVGVQKAILSFICTLVYRPINEREHPDQPVLASSVLSSGATLPLQENLPSPGPECQFTPAKTFTRPMAGSRASGSVRKRRLDSILAPTYETPAKQIAAGSQPPPTPLSVMPASESPSMVSPAPRQTGVRGPTVVEPLRHPLLYHQMRLWSVVRRQHGLMLLLQQLDVKQPISEADSVRTLACRGLVGLARSEEVRSMLAKLPLFTKGSLQLLMKEPILPDRLVEHAEFCRYATILIRLVLGSLSDGITATDMSLDRVRRAVIVAKTRIQWDQEELLELIWRHLQAKGLHDAAAALQREANLKLDHAVPLQLPFYDDIGATPPHPFSSNTAPQPLATENSSSTSTFGPSGDAGLATPTLRVTKLRATVGGTLSTPKLYRDRLERPGVPNLYMKQPTAPADSEMSLSKIVESFLLHQHAQCPYPVSVCPRFSLYHPHRCPEPQQDTSVDYTRRLFMREAFSGSMRMRCSRKYDRRFLHSRFQPISVVRELDEDVQTACCFSRTDDGAFLGTTSGAVTWVNVEDGGLPVELFRAQTSPISRLEHSRDGRRLLVCADWGEPAMVVARLTPTSTDGLGGGGGNGTPWRANTENLMFSIEEARYGEFCRTGLQNKVVATYGKMAKVYDLTTGTKIADLFSSVKQSDYILNKATFSMDDNLVLNDGVLWDLRCSGSVDHYRKGLSSLQATASGPAHRPIHKIDKFQDLVSGVFHPNGLEVIVGSAVWDMRTWRLLHTVQALDRMEARFTENVDAIYAGIFGPDYDDVLEELGANRLAMQSMFRTVDALDYSLIASVDVKHRIEQLALDFTGQYLAIIAKVGEKNSNDPITQCRIYCIGRKRSEREADNDEDEQPNEDDDDDDDDDEDVTDDDDDDEDMDEDDDDDDEEEEDESTDGLSPRRLRTRDVTRTADDHRNTSSPPDHSDDTWEVNSHGSSSSSDSSWETEEEVEVPPDEVQDDDHEDRGEDGGHPGGAANMDDPSNADA